MVLNKRGLEKAFSPKKTTKTTVGNQFVSPVSRIKVFVRIRPFSYKECTNSNTEVIKICDEKALIFDPQIDEDGFFFRGVQQKGRDLTKKMKKNMLFEFDRVFGEEISNEQVYEETTKDIVSAVFDGYNCSVFAYGATGAGKTFTMLGSQEQPGITYLTIVELLNRIEENEATMNVTLAASYIEVYNENVRDLLNPTSPSLHLRDNGGCVTIAGLRVEQIKARERLFSLLETGNCNRSQHPTDSNEESSRSHAIFQVHVHIVTKGSGQVKLSKLSMIDLAGSERGAATGCSGVRFKEGSNINKSLLALGNCINALADGLRHVPYRDSKLTRILKDSLGGNCRTVMVANISPSSASFEDSYNTLKYAYRARTIKSKVTKNFLNENLTVHQYKKKVEQLESELAKIKADGMVMPDLESWWSEIASVKQEKRQLYETLLTLEGEGKMIQWRLINKENQMNHLNFQQKSSESFIRMNVAVDQLKARAAGISSRKEELLTTAQSLATKETALRERIKALPYSKMLESSLDGLNNEIALIECKMEMLHKDKLIRLEGRENLSQKKALEAFVPLCDELFSLVRVFDHLTPQLKEKYQGAIRALDGIKGVSWNEELGENVELLENEEDRRHLSRLTSYREPLPPQIASSRRKQVEEEEHRRKPREYNPYPLKQRNNTPSSKGTWSKGVLAVKSGCSRSKLMNKENLGLGSKPKSFYGGSSTKSKIINRLDQMYPVLENNASRMRREGKLKALNSDNNHISKHHFSPWTNK